MCGVGAAVAAAAAAAEASVEDHESREEKMEKFNMETSRSPDPRGTCQQKTKKKKRKGLGDEGQFCTTPRPFHQTTRKSVALASWNSSLACMFYDAAIPLGSVLGLVGN
ncbi:hypothetical protein RUM43_001589 [Polyplax serrata]|uniref:Uncharacterized protein n=1 Tax=Polyplax serrata TaxID=468196 RepID=A0AAN8SE41_POLSC